MWSRSFFEKSTLKTIKISNINLMIFLITIYSKKIFIFKKILNNYCPISFL